MTSTANKTVGSGFAIRDFSNAREVSFDSEGARLAGYLFVPDDFSEQEKYPAAVFIGPMTGLKDQVAGLYASRLSKYGFVTLSFDPRFYGQSEGEPRQYESPSKKVEDLSNAVTYAASLPFVDDSKINLVGICAGGAIAAKAAANDPRIHRFVGIAGYYDDVAAKKAMFGANYDARIQAGRSMREAFEQGAEPGYLPAVAEKPAETPCVMGQIPGTENEPHAYYGTERGHSKNYVNRIALMSFEDMLSFDVIEQAGDIKAPTRIIHGSVDAYCPAHFAKNLYSALTTAKDYVEISTTNHIELYDDEQKVNDAVAYTNSWLSAHPIH